MHTNYPLYCEQCDITNEYIFFSTIGGYVLVRSSEDASHHHVAWEMKRPNQLSITLRRLKAQKATYEIPPEDIIKHLLVPDMVFQSRCLFYSFSLWHWSEELHSSKLDSFLTQFVLFVIVKLWFLSFSCVLGRFCNWTQWTNENIDANRRYIWHGELITSNKIQWGVIT